MHALRPDQFVHQPPLSLHFTKELVSIIFCCGHCFNDNLHYNYHIRCDGGFGSMHEVHDSTMSFIQRIGCYRGHIENYLGKTLHKTDSETIIVKNNKCRV